MTYTSSKIFEYSPLESFPFSSQPAYEEHVTNHVNQLFCFVLYSRERLISFYRVERGLYIRSSVSVGARTSHQTWSMPFRILFDSRSVRLQTSFPFPEVLTPCLMPLKIENVLQNRKTERCMDASPHETFKIFRPLPHQQKLSRLLES